jgi:hypothetical protein
MNLKIRDHAEACAVLNALREHRDNFPYYRAPLDTADKRAAWSNINRLVADAHHIYEAFVDAAWREDAAASYVTTDSNGTPYHTTCGEPVAWHRGNTARRLGECRASAED